MDTDQWFQCYEKPTPRAVMQHAARVTEADLEMPIILTPDGEIADGIHRLMKADLLGLKTIKAKRLTEMPERRSSNIGRGKTDTGDKLN